MGTETLCKWVVLAQIDAGETAGSRARNWTCQVLRTQGLAVSSRSYRAWKRRPSAARTHQDALILDVMHALRTPDAKGLPQPEMLYGRRKMTAWLARNGFPDASKRTVDWLMREAGMNRLVCGRRTSTTSPARSSVVLTATAGDRLLADVRQRIWRVRDWIAASVFGGHRLWHHGCRGGCPDTANVAEERAL